MAVITPVRGVDFGLISNQLVVLSAPHMAWDLSWNHVPPPHPSLLSVSTMIYPNIKTISKDFEGVWRRTGWEPPCSMCELMQKPCLSPTDCSPKPTTFVFFTSWVLGSCRSNGGEGPDDRGRMSRGTGRKQTHRWKWSDYDEDDDNCTVRWIKGAVHHKIKLKFSCSPTCIISHFLCLVWLMNCSFKLSDRLLRLTTVSM